MSSIKSSAGVGNYKHDPLIHNFSAARQILPYLLKLKPVNSILDVGCGTGTWLAVASELAVMEILGVDGAGLDQQELKIPNESFINCDLTQPINLKRKFDMVLCLEVAEHLPEKFAKTLIESLTVHGDFIIFSAAIPGQGGQNHLNEQWPEYWQQLFAAQGFKASETLRDHFWYNNEIEWWYRQNITVYAPETVLTSLNLAFTDFVKAVVHPGLFEQKLQVIDAQRTLIEHEIWDPPFKSALKRLIKSIIR